MSAGVHRAGAMEETVGCTVGCPLLLTVPQTPARSCSRILSHDPTREMSNRFSLTVCVLSQLQLCGGEGKGSIGWLGWLLSFFKPLLKFTFQS